MKKILIVILIFIVLSTTAYADNGALLLQQCAIEAPGTSLSDWSAIALCVSDISFEKDKYISSLKDYIAEKYKTEQKLHTVKSTEWHRVIIALNLLGEDAENFCGINLVNDGIYYRENLGRQGLNGYIWALIALSSGNFNEPNDAVNTKETLISTILSSQNQDGGFSLGKENSSCDVTAMAIYALSPYTEHPLVKTAIEGAINYLVFSQNEDGTFSENGVPNSESISQVIIALSAVGKSLDKFPNIYNSLLEFGTENGFSHEVNEETNAIATYQAICAIAAMKKNVPIYSNHIIKQPQKTETATEHPVFEQNTVPFSEIEEVITEDTNVPERTELQQKDEKEYDFINVFCFILLFVLFCVIIALRSKR